MRKQKETDPTLAIRAGVPHQLRSCPPQTTAEMKPIRVLLVDDSLVIRKLLSETLSADPAIEVVGTAGNGRIALAKIPALAPDLVILDIEMPVMNGLETLAALRKLYPQLPVIMCGNLTERGAATTLEALSLGAFDHATKPSNPGSTEVAMGAIRTDLIPKIKALRGSPVSLSAPLIGPARTLRHRPVLPTPIEIVAIGASTGGPNALAAVLPLLAKDFPVPIVLVQHMPPVFTRLLADRLASRSSISVGEGVSGAALVPGQAWIAPGNFHMTVSRSGLQGRLELNQNPPEHSCRPAVDVLFHSVAAAFGGHTLGVVMTGMGADGVRGSAAIRDAGGEVIVQDESSSVVWGMPGLVQASGHADAVYPLESLAVEITRRVLGSRELGARHRSIPAALEAHAK